MHVDSVLMYLRRETYLCDIARLLISFERNGMHFSFYNFFGGGGGEAAFSTLCWGERREKGRFEPPEMLAGGGDRSRRGPGTFFLFLSPRDQPKPGKFQVCHRMPHLGRHLLVPNRLPNVGQGCS